MVSSERSFIGVREFCVFSIIHKTRTCVGYERYESYTKPNVCSLSDRKQWPFNFTPHSWDFHHMFRFKDNFKNRSDCEEKCFLWLFLKKTINFSSRYNFILTMFIHDLLAVKSFVKLSLVEISTKIWKQNKSSSSFHDKVISGQNFHQISITTTKHLLKCPLPVIKLSLTILNSISFSCLCLGSSSVLHLANWSTTHSNNRKERKGNK